MNIFDKNLFVGVYGTLRKGGAAHHHLLDSEFIKTAKIKGKLYNIGWFPGLMEGEGDVLIEIYQINRLTLETLDYFEGVPDLFRREVVKIDEEDVFIYFYNRGITGGEIQGGDWLRFCEERKKENACKT